MRDLAREGMTMLVITHEVGFAREASNRVVFMDEGRIIEDSPTVGFFEAPREERARQFLSKVIKH
jgi:ABC-type polar amino acid transport system ATPase subunit